MRLATMIPLGLLIVAATCPLKTDGGEPKKSSPIVVQKTRITFDPKTCTEGKAMFFWGFGSVYVTMLGHKDGNCLFQYEFEQESSSMQIYRVQTPVDSGQVVIEAEGGGRLKVGDDSNRWSGVYTSFTRKQATFLRSSK